MKVKELIADLPERNQEAEVVTVYAKVPDYGTSLESVSVAKDGTVVLEYANDAVDLDFGDEDDEDEET